MEDEPGMLKVSKRANVMMCNEDGNTEISWKATSQL